MTWQGAATPYPPDYHCMNFLVRAIADEGETVEFARDERTEGCYGAIVSRRGDKRIVVWLIDNRLSHEAEKEDPAAARLKASGAFVYCAQWEDAMRIGARWLPIAATPDYLQAALNDRALPPPSYDLAFVGYVRDSLRADALRRVSQLVQVCCASNVFGADAVAVYRRARAGLNIPTLHGLPAAYDINMRVFEIASTGVPLVTNSLHTLRAIGFTSGINCLTYRGLEDIASTVAWLRSKPQQARAIGAAGQRLILARHTYAHRARTVLHDLWD